MSLYDSSADPFGYLGHDGVSESSKSVHPMWDVRRYAGDVQSFPPHRFMAFCQTSVHPGGKPCNHSTHAGFRLFGWVSAPLGESGCVSELRERPAVCNATC